MVKAMGGTELMVARLESALEEAGLHDKVQVVPSRVRYIEDDKIRIFWAHDLPGDPESDFLKDQNLRDRFHHFVFVSNWQFWEYVKYYNLPMEKCSIIRNGIKPFPSHDKPKNRVNLVYFSTPHRGLQILLPVYNELYKKYGDKIHLDVYSSFSLYGWSERDIPYQPLFDYANNHPGISYHGAQSNETIRKALMHSHILAYPCIWQETSCLVLIESMSAGLTCVHPNLAALYETSGGLTRQYEYTNDLNLHASRFMSELDSAIEYELLEAKSLWRGVDSSFTSNYADSIYDWNYAIKPQWIKLVNSLKDVDKSLPSQQYYEVKV